MNNSLTNKQAESLHLAHSIMNLEDEKFLQKEMSEFESKLEHPASYKGFSRVAREQSIMMTNTQGYRNYKLEKNRNSKTVKTEEK